MSEELNQDVKIDAVASSGEETSATDEVIKVRKGKKRADLQGIVTVKATFNNKQ